MEISKLVLYIIAFYYLGLILVILLLSIKPIRKLILNMLLSEIEKDIKSIKKELEILNSNTINLEQDIIQQNENFENKDYKIVVNVPENEDLKHIKKLMPNVKERKVGEFGHSVNRINTSMDGQKS